MADNKVELIIREYTPYEKELISKYLKTHKPEKLDEFVGEAPDFEEDTTEEYDVL